MRSNRRRGVVGPYVSRASVELVRLLAERGLSQTKVALRLKVSRPSVSDWCAGKKQPDGENLEKIEAWSAETDPKTGKTHPRILKMDWLIRPDGTPLESSQAEVA